MGLPLILLQSNIKSWKNFIQGNQAFQRQADHVTIKINIQENANLRWNLIIFTTRNIIFLTKSIGVGNAKTCEKEFGFVSRTGSQKIIQSARIAMKIKSHSETTRRLSELSRVNTWTHNKELWMIEANSNQALVKNTKQAQTLKTHWWKVMQ